MLGSAVQYSAVKCSVVQIDEMQCATAVDTICDVLPENNNDAVQSSQWIIDKEASVQWTTK